jgi:hypothetical protein
MISVKKPENLAMLGCAHLLFGSLEFPREKVKRVPVMIPALPHHGKPMIGAIITGHSIRNMMKK